MHINLGKGDPRLGLLSRLITDPSADVIHCACRLSRMGSTLPSCALLTLCLTLRSTPLTTWRLRYPKTSSECLLQRGAQIHECARRGVGLL